MGIRVQGPGVREQGIGCCRGEVISPVLSCCFFDDGLTPILSAGAMEEFEFLFFCLFR